MVKAWIDRTQCGWVDAVLNSGVTTRSRRTTPEDGLRAAARAEADEALETWTHLVTPPDAVTRRREASEHESAHAISAKALGADVSVAAISADDSGLCRFSTPGLSDLERAAVMLASGVWINNFRSMMFPRGATGTQQDQRDAIRTGANLQQATQLAFEVLRTNYDSVIKFADTLDRDGHWLGPSAS